MYSATFCNFLAATKNTVFLWLYSVALEEIRSMSAWNKTSLPQAKTTSTRKIWYLKFLQVFVLVGVDFASNSQKFHGPSDNSRVIWRNLVSNRIREVMVGVFPEKCKSSSQFLKEAHPYLRNPFSKWSRSCCNGEKLFRTWGGGEGNRVACDSAESVSSATEASGAGGTSSMGVSSFFADSFFFDSARFGRGDGVSTDGDPGASV